MKSDKFMEKTDIISRIDLIDRNIVTILKEDARTSYSKIADDIGKTEATVRRRVNRLIDEKIIKKFTIVLDDKKMDNPTNLQVPKN